MVGESEKRLALYYCYEPSDKALYEALKKHLTTLLQQDQIAGWHAGEIKAGTEWQKETAHHLRTADVILLLVSADFIASETISLEAMHQALAKHERNEALVIPILLRSVDLENTSISKLQSLPRNGLAITSWNNQDEAFSDVVQGLRKALKDLMLHQKTARHSDNNRTGNHTSTFNDKPGTRNEAHLVIPSAFHFNAPLPHPDELYGRKRECAILRKRIYEGSATSIVGPRRIGKTWLMQYIKLFMPRQLGTRFRISYIDATSPRCVTIAGFVAFALEGMGISGPHACTELDLDYMDHVVRHLRKNGFVPVLCIDEFECLIHEDTFDLRFFINLRAIAQTGLVLVTASRHPLNEVISSALDTSPFFNIFEKLILGPFSAQEAKAFADAKGKEADFSDQECELLLHYGQIDTQQWQPARLQLVGDLLQGDKMFAEQEDPQYYRPDTPDYRTDFEMRLEDKYQEMGI